MSIILEKRILNDLENGDIESFIGSIHTSALFTFTGSDANKFLNKMITLYLKYNTERVNMDSISILPLIRNCKSTIELREICDNLSFGYNLGDTSSYIAGLIDLCQNSKDKQLKHNLILQMITTYQRRNLTELKIK